MKILIVHNTYLSKNIGGEDMVFRNELQLLKKYLGDENVFSYSVSNDDLNIFSLPFSIWFSFSHYHNIRKIVRDQHIDVVHVHNFFPILTPSVFKAARDAGARTVLTLHNYRLWCIAATHYRDGFGICEKCVGQSWQGVWKRCYKKSFFLSTVVYLAFRFYRLTKAFDQIDYFIALTNFQKKKVMQLGIDEKRIFVKPNCLELSPVTVSQRQGFVFVGKLQEDKGIEVLLEAWRELDDRFVLTVIGSGSLEKTLKSRYRQRNIIFKGQCSREETIRSIAGSRFLLQPSVWYEPFSLTIIEAFSCGVPVIAFNRDTRRELITDGINGFLAEPGELKKVIEKALNWPDYEKLCSNALEKSKEFSNHVVAEQQLAIYRRILEA
ncbi:MAG: glycosyltransferase [Candidatus Wallbacteria bacterium]|nr:glycosyltransferase [Candidatus Wallbacteria bacterium]